MLSRSINCARCVSTVLTLISRSCAICFVVRPSAISCSTSRCRGLNVANRSFFETPLPYSINVFREVSGEIRSEEHTSELQSQSNLVCRLLLEKKKKKNKIQLLLKNKLRIYT